jgi:tRNA synthetases class I (R)
MRNIIDAIENSVTASAANGLSVIPVGQPGRSDVSVVVRRADDLADQARTAANALLALPEVDSVHARRERLLVHVADSVIAELGADIETGHLGSALMEPLLDGQKIIVDFCDPNATKALHVGHLRNLAIGNAFAALCRCLGAHVVTQSQIADVGRQMGEAIAGYLESRGPRTPSEASLKSDHFVGECYAAYAADSAGDAAWDQAAGDVVGRELGLPDDHATDVLARWQQGDPDIQALWHRLRGWVCDGHVETLARLGMSFDHEIFESHHFGDHDAVVAEALDAGILTREPAGSVVFETGDEQYPVYPLTRRDGFPTQNLRALVTYHSLMAGWNGGRFVQVCGAEWRAHHAYTDAILRRLHPSRTTLPTDVIFYEMVTSPDGEVVSSSSGDAPLLDDLMDRLEHSAEISELVRAGCGHVTAGELARVSALTHCLAAPLGRAMRVTADDILASGSSTGMLLAGAWAAALASSRGGRSAPEPSDPAYRYMVIQSQVLGRLAWRSFLERDLMIIVKFLAHFGRHVLAGPLTPSTARLARSVLSMGFGAVGVHPRSVLSEEDGGRRPHADVRA